MNNICATNKDRAEKRGRIVMASCITLTIVCILLLLLMAVSNAFFTNPVTAFVLVGVYVWLYNSLTDEHQRKIHKEIIIDSVIMCTVVYQYIVSIIRRDMIRTV